MRTLIPFLALVAACSSEQLSDTDATVITVDPDDPGVDSDGDGLSDLVETTGWTVYVDETGAPDVNGLTELFVTSNPNRADTDGDGLNDREERANLADPTRADTDRDGLRDVDEVRRWRTSPASVDSDGDSRGPDASPATAPDNRLFDGAELALIDSPTLPGLQVPGPTATSPLDPDTDGDGVWDGVELSSGSRSPILAEMPELSLTTSDASSIGIYLDVVYTEDQSEAETFSVETGFGAGTSFGVHSAASLLISFWTSLMVEASADLAIGVDLESLGAQIGASSRTEAHVGSSVSTSFTRGMSAEFRTNATQVIEEVDEVTLDSSRSIAGGEIVAELELQNTGPIPFSVVNPAINVSWLEPGGTSRPLGVLQPVNPEQAYTLAVGERVSLVLADDSLPTSRILDALANPDQLVFTPGNLEIVGAGDDAYAFVEEDVNDRTATLLVDLGDGTIERHRVAAHVATDANGDPLGITVSDMLSVAGIEHDSGSDGNGAYRVAGYPTELYVGDAPDLQAEGLDATGYPLSGGPGDRFMKEGWAAYIAHADGEVTIQTNLLAARAVPGDDVHFIRALDLDRDGVIALEEALVGSSDDAFDSDDDGLSDFFEVREGWWVRAYGQPPLRVFPSASDPDADGDGLSDTDELALGTHPRRADTDGDGVADPGDADPLTYDGLRLTNIRTTLFDCSEEGCRNEWTDTPGYNLVALGWDRSTNVTALVLREVLPLDTESTFAPSDLRTVEDVDDAIADGFVTRVFEGRGATTEDYDLVADARLVYHFYGIVEGIDGVTYFAYSGSDAVSFEPEPWTTDYYHVVRIAIDSFHVDESNHGNGHEAPWNLYYRHLIQVEYGADVNNPEVVAGMDPVLQSTYFHRGPNQPLGDVGQSYGVINDGWVGYRATNVVPEWPEFPVVTACLRQTGRLHLRLANFDSDPWGDYGWNPVGPTETVVDFYRDPDEWCLWIPPWTPPADMPDEWSTLLGRYMSWGYGNSGCDDRQIQDRMFVFSNEETGFDRTNPPVADVGQSWPIAVSYGAPALPADTFVYREDFPNRIDRDWYSGETSRHATRSFQHVGLDYVGYLRDVDAEILCDVGFGVNPPTIR